jgi:predicted NAD/FAD-dependent oxidoreductase
MSMTTAIIGAGIAGLTCARMLTKAGESVTCFDKARGPGGRMSSRRSDVGAFDHGAQYFTARDPDFQAVVADWNTAGVVATWDGAIASIGPEAATSQATKRWCGVPRMSALTRFLSDGIELRAGCRIAEVSGSPGAWMLTDTEGESSGPWERVLVTTPAPQAVPLLQAAPAMAEQAAACPHLPCWAAMLGMDSEPAVDWAGAFVDHPALAWVARDHSKPGRAPGIRWVLHARSDWSVAHQDDSKESVRDALMAACAELGFPLTLGPYWASHRWLLARPAEPLETEFLWDSTLGIGAAGDWCIDARVEAAWLSGSRLAQAVLRGD